MNRFNTRAKTIRGSVTPHHDVLGHPAQKVWNQDLEDDVLDGLSDDEIEDENDNQDQPGFISATVVNEGVEDGDDDEEEEEAKDEGKQKNIKINNIHLSGDVDSD